MRNNLASNERSTLTGRDFLSYLEKALRWLPWLRCSSPASVDKELYQVTLTEEHLNVLNRISHWRRSSVELALEIRGKSERYYDRFPDGTRIKVADILDALPTTEFLNAARISGYQQL